MRQSNLSLNNILDDEFLGTLAKSADLYKIGSNSVLDPEEIRIGLKVVPRAVMSMLISELSNMPINNHKDIKLPFGNFAYISVNKNANDDYTGSVYSNNKLVYDFKNRSIPGLGIILLSTFELYDLEELSKPNKESEDIDKKVQKLIDERMELHSLVGKVVDDKIAQREAIHKLMMNKLSDALKDQDKKAELAQMQADVARSMAYNNQQKIAEKKAHQPFSEKPLEIKPQDITKKETSIKKGSPLKAFLERKKKAKEYSVKIEKSETVSCPDCSQIIFGSNEFSGCICYGQDQHRKIWIKKNEDGIQLKFSRGWDQDNIEQLLETLRKNNGKY